MRRHLSFANVISVLALFVAMGGTSYAALQVTGRTVKNSTLTGADVKNSSLTGTDVKNSSLTGTDVKNSSLTGADVQQNSLTGLDLKDGSIAKTDLAPNALDPYKDLIAGGDLAGLYPNPRLRDGVAAANLGPAGGALTGSFPNPQLATGVSAANYWNGPVAPGTTAVGAWGMDVNRDVRNTDRLSGSAVISYPFRLAAAPKIEILFGAPGSSSACRGDVANPTSPPGYLCVYVGNPTDVNAGDPTPTIDTFDPAKAQGSGEIGRYGVLLTSTTSSYHGNWSLTAP